MDGSTTGSDPAHEVDLEPAGAGLDRYVEPAPGRRRFRWAPILIGCLVLVLVGGGAVVVGQRANRRVDGPALTPASPIDGKATKRHPVRVTPDTGLVDGQVVTVTGREFPPGADIGVVMCTNAAASLGIDACDVSTSSFLAGQQVRTDADGSFSLQYPVRTRFRIKDPNAPAPSVVPTTRVESLTPGKDSASDGVSCEVLADGSKRCWVMAEVGPSDPLAGTMEVDCLTGNVDPAQWAARVAEQGEQQAVATDPGSFTCLVAAGVITDYDESGGWPIAFEGEVFTAPPATATTAPAAVPTTESTTPGLDPSSTTGPGAVPVPTTPQPTPPPFDLPYPPKTPPLTITPDPTAPDCAPVTIPGSASGPSIPDGCIPPPGAPPP